MATFHRDKNMNNLFKITILLNLFSRWISDNKTYSFSFIYSLVYNLNYTNYETHTETQIPW